MNPDAELPSEEPAESERPPLIGHENTQPQLIRASVSTSFSGPIPPPSVLAEYEKLVTGAADRLIRMAEQQAEHHRDLEKSLIQAEISDVQAEREERKRGQRYGLTIGIAALGFGALVTLMAPSVTGQIVGGVLGSSGVIGLVTVFVLGRRTAGGETQQSASAASRDSETMELRETGDS